MEAVKVFKFGRNTIRQPHGKAVDVRKRGGKRKKEKTPTRNGGVEESGKL